MDFEFLSIAAKELAANSPFALIIIAFMFFFSHQNKVSLDLINSMYQTALHEIRASHEESMQELRKLLKASHECTRTNTAKSKS